MSRSRVHAGVLVNHPIQHIAPGLRVLAGRPDVQIRVYYWHAAEHARMDPEFGQYIRWEADLHSGYDWWSPPTEFTAGRRCAAVLGKLRRDRPQVLLCFGWRSPIARLGSTFAHLTGTPLLYYGDSHPDYSVTGRRTAVRRQVLRLAFHAASGALATGPANRRFYLEHGLPAARIHPGVLPADVEVFAAAAGRREVGTGTASGSTPVTIGCAGKFVAHKAVGDLIEAAARLPDNPPWRLWLIGDGPMRSHLTDLVKHRRLGDRVSFLGFRNVDELPGLLAAVDILAVPSYRDHRPLVVLEAMAAGAATVVSSATGLWGSGDLVEPEQTGLVFPAGDVAALADCLHRLLRDAPLRSGLAAAGHARARHFGPDAFAETAAAALRRVAGDGGRVPA